MTKTRKPRQLAGTLCPNPVLDSGERLDTVLGDGFAVITTRRPHEHQRALLENRGAVVHLAGPGSEMERWLRRRHAAAAAIRPDRTVMCAGRNLTALCEVVPQSIHLGPAS